MKQLRAGPGLVAAAVLATVAAVSMAAVPAVAAEQPGQRATRSDQPCPELPALQTQCGAIRVPLDRANPEAGHTTVVYARIRHRGMEPALGTIAFNPGGPGLAPIVGLAQQPELFVAIFGQLLDTHDMLVVDPRGTGRSAALHCTDLSADNLPATRSALLGAVESCGGELRENARYYTTAATADDLDAVRAELRIRRLDLIGESYRAALGGDHGPLIEVVQSMQPPPVSDQPAPDAIKRARRAGRASDGEAFQSLALTASVICNDYPTLWDRRASIPERTREFLLQRRQLNPSTFAPFSPRAWTNGIYDRGNFCLRWPDRGGRASSAGGRFPDVPVLVLSGELDANTPTEEGHAAAQQFRRARVIEVPNTGHVPEHHEAANPCVMALQSQFLRTHRIGSTARLGTIPAIAVDA